MSVRIMTLAWAVDLPAGDKLVLLALADCANDEGYCYPGIRTLCTKTGKSERSLQGALKDLEASGHITRDQVAGKGCNYTIHPRQSGQGYEPPLHHYVYRTTRVDTGEFYVGARSCHCDPCADAYMGSGNWVKDQVRLGAQLRKEIVETYPSRDALAQGEAEHTATVFGHPLCRNAKKATPGTLTPATPAGRMNCGAQKTAKTPAISAGKPLGTVITKKDKPSSVKRAFAAPPDVPAQTWTDFLASPKRRKAGMSETAYAGICSNLRILAEHGFPPGEMVALAVERGWTTVKLEWVENDRRSSHSLGRHQPADGLSSTARAALAVFGAPGAGRH